MASRLASSVGWPTRYALHSREAEAFLATYRAAAVDDSTREAMRRGPPGALPQPRDQGAAPLGAAAGDLAARWQQADTLIDELAHADWCAFSEVERRVLQAQRRRLLARILQLTQPPKKRPAIETARVIIARQIIRGRKASGWTQAELATRAGIRQETISRLETGKHSAGLKTMAKIDRALKRAGV